MPGSKYSTALDIRIAWVYATAPIGAGLSILHLIAALMQRWSGNEDPSPPLHTPSRPRMSVLGYLVIIFLLLLAVGVPVAVSMAIASIAAIAFGTDLPMVVVGQRMLAILDSFPFLALPFFVAAAYSWTAAASRSGSSISPRSSWPHYRRLAQVLIGTNLVMSAFPAPRPPTAPRPAACSFPL